jgi:hypothetical protein
MKIIFNVNNFFQTLAFWLFTKHNLKAYDSVKKQ